MNKKIYKAIPALPLVYIPSLSRLYWTKWSEHKEVPGVFAWSVHPDMNDMIVVYAFNSMFGYPAFVSPLLKLADIIKNCNAIASLDLWHTTSEWCDADLLIRLQECEPKLEPIQ